MGAEADGMARSGAPVPADAKVDAAPAAGLKPLVAEVIGSGLFTFVVIAAGILAERFAIHNVGLALLMTALAGAAAFAVLALVLRPLNATYFNPALALALALERRLPLTAALTIAAGQIAAAFLGLMAAHLVTNTGLVQAASQIQTGEGVWLGEFFGTVIFIFAMLVLARPDAGRAALIGGVCLLAIALATPSISFANPALTLARTLTDSFTAIRLMDGLIICGVQFAAAIGAFGLRAWLFPADEAS
jgi:glycerol uptake facilitator-like aquaporin